MRDWRSLSFGYLEAMLSSKKRIPGAEKCLHQDSNIIYKFIVKYVFKFKKYPPFSRIQERFNVDLERYKLSGWALRDIAERLRGELVKDSAEELIGKLTHLCGQDSIITQTELSNLVTECLAKSSTGSETAGKSILEAVKILRHYRDHQELKVCDFGFPYLDQCTGGITRKQYTVIFASSTEGKSTMSRRLAVNMALQGKRVVYITLEEDAMKSIVKGMAVTAEFNSQEALRGRVTLDMEQKTEAVIEKIKESGGDLIFVDTVDSKDESQLITLRDAYNPDVIILDQITLFTAGGSSEEKEVTRVTRMLKGFCQNHDIPVIALTQMMRKQEVQGADFRNIGYAASIGQDADLIIYVHPTEYDGDASRKRLTLVKFRDGRRNIHVDFDWDLDHGVIRETQDYSTTMDDI